MLWKAAYYKAKEKKKEKKSNVSLGNREGKKKEKGTLNDTIAKLHRVYTAAPCLSFFFSLLSFLSL